MSDMAEPLPAFDPDYDYDAIVTYDPDDPTVENDSDCADHADKDED
jgi:hypothetical protein